MKRQNLQLPGGSFKTHYKREKPSVSRCGQCGRKLPGIPRLTSSKVGKLSASERRVERMYGGQLCHECLRDLLKQRVRSTYLP